MQKRHDDLLTSRLEEVYDNGVAFVSWSELYRWYDTQKIAAGTKRDLSQRWDDISEGEFGSLVSVENKAGMFLTAEERVKSVYET